MGNCTDTTNTAQPQNKPSSILQHQVQEVNTIPDENQQNDKILPSALPEELTIQSLKNDLLKIKPEIQLINKDIIEFIFEEIKNYYMSSSQKTEFLAQLTKYLTILQDSSSNKLQINAIKNKLLQFATSLHRNVNEIHFNHLEAIKILEKLFHITQTNGKINLNSLTYNLKDQKQISMVAKVVKQCCYEDLNAFYFLSAYLVECCKKMSSSGNYEVVQVEQQLKEVLNMLKKEHPPNDKKINENTTMIHDSATQKLQNTLKFQLKKFQPQHRNDKLEQFILQVAGKAQNKYGELISLTKAICINSNGTGYKAGLKAKKGGPKSSIDRIKQKLLSKQFKKCQIPSDEKNLQKFLQFQKQKYHVQIAQIFSKVNEDIPFNVSDMLRGKCMHERIDEIKRAGLDIIKKAQSKGYSVQVDNRLAEKTSDLVLKIKIGDVIAQFQIAYKFNVVENEFNHKLYELSRSKFYSALSTLFIFNENSQEYFRQLYYRMKKIESMSNQIRIQREGQKLESVTELINRFKMFLTSKSYSLNQYQDLSLANNIKEIKKRMAKINDSPSQQTTDKQSFNLYFSGVFWQKFHKMDNALKIYYEIEKALKNKPNDKTILSEKCQIVQSIARILKEQGKVNQSLKYYEEALKYQQQVHGQGNSKSSTTLTNLGVIYRMKGNYPKALQYFQRSLCIEERQKGKNHIDCSNILNNMGILYRHEGNYPLALKYLKQCLEIQQSQLGTEHINCASTLNNIGMVYKYQKKYDEALSYYQKCLKIEENVRGKDHIDTASTLNNIGLVKKNQQKFEEALYYYEKALAIEQRVKGKDDFACATTLNNIGVVYRRLKKYDQALVYYHRCLKIQQTIKGNDCIDCASTLNNIGMAYKNQGKYEQAIKYIKQCLRIQQTVKGNQNIDSADTLENLGDVYKVMKNNNQARKAYQESLNIFTKVLGQNSSEAEGIREKINGL